MYTVGRLCVKIAGRDAGREAVIVDVLEKNLVLIDGNVRRRKCNINHLEPTQKTVDIKKNASHEDIAAAFKKLKLPIWETKPKSAGEKPKKVRSEKKKEAAPVKQAPKTKKKEAPKKEAKAEPKKAVKK